ncbi:hypothetical protein ABZ825_17820 [Streptomyces tauricus]|uniref:hypothetical protein n=1 Tax=Streptomyces tauricus TaxID=68274 RepID=UPI0033FB45C4
MRAHLRRSARLRTVPAPVETICELLEALDAPPGALPHDGDDVEAHTVLWRSDLFGRRFLLLLDDAREADQVHPLIPGTPGCMALVTSRERWLWQGSDLVGFDCCSPS